jgi:hypothetical protein
MPTSVRLDPRIESIVARMARRRGRTRSEVIREAILALHAAETTPGGGPTPFQLIEGSVGIAHSGGRQLSRDTGKKFREVLAARRGGPRAR